jgi:hypothetical protein
MANTLTVTLGGAVELLLRPPPPDWDCIISARFEGFTATAKGKQMAYTLPSGNQVQVRVEYVDANGHPATVDGDVRWDTSAANVAAVTVDSGDSNVATIASATDLGTAQISATADADLGSGVRELVCTLDVTVVAGEAVAGTISPTGESTPIP